MQRLRPLDIALLAIFVPLWRALLCPVSPQYLSRSARADSVRSWPPPTVRRSIRLSAPFGLELGPNSWGSRSAINCYRLAEPICSELVRSGLRRECTSKSGLVLRVLVVFLHEGVLDTRLLVLHPFAFPWRNAPALAGFCGCGGRNSVPSSRRTHCAGGFPGGYDIQLSLDILCRWTSLADVRLDIHRQLLPPSPCFHFCSASPCCCQKNWRRQGRACRAGRGCLPRLGPV